ncbi:MAG: hypothetical protein VKP62_12870 [Candidatus Sericytochromatia bacterium]|nr:hypothetical protein [Candidatus Sericytochromatia bacterium]
MACLIWLGNLPAQAQSAAEPTPASAHSWDGLVAQLERFGLRTRVTPAAVWVDAVVPGSPAFRAGIRRPDRGWMRLAAINAQPLTRPLSEQGWAEGAVGAPETLSFAVRRMGGEPERWRGPYRLTSASPAGAAVERLTASASLTPIRDVRLGLAQTLIAGQFDEALSQIEARSERDSLSQDLAEALLLAGESNQRERLDAADMRAASGRYEEALRLLAGARGGGTWSTLVSLRRVAWRRAIQQRKHHLATRTGAHRRAVISAPAGQSVPPKTTVPVVPTIKL